MGERETPVIEVWSTGEVVGDPGGSLHRDGSGPGQPPDGTDPVWIAHPDPGRLFTARIFTVGLATGICLTLATQYGMGLFRKYNESKTDPMSYASDVSATNPTQIDPVDTFRKLDRLTSTRWSMSSFEFDPRPGARDLDDGLGRLETVAVVPDREATNLLGVYTNLLDPTSVQRNGAFIMMRFGITANTEGYLRQHPKAFAATDLGKRADVYRAGTFAVFYAPPADASGDRTEGLRTFIKQFTQCPTRLGDCEPTQQVADFNDWAPRHG